MRVTLPYNRGQGLHGIVHADTNDPDKFTIQTRQDVSGIIDFCREKQEAMRHAPKDGMVHAAEVPIPIYEQAVREGWDNPDGWRAWLNNPDNQCFRTWKGRV